jgi:hypothetical protein
VSSAAVAPEGGKIAEATAALVGIWLFRRGRWKTIQV